jgi:hypothetical protein
MCVAVNSIERLVFDTKKIDEVSNEQATSAFLSFIGYGGEYFVKDGIVKHKVFTSLHPDWVGRTLERRVRFHENNVLTLIDDKFDYRGFKGSIELTWDRVKV